MAYNNRNVLDNGSNPEAVQNYTDKVSLPRSYFDESMIHTTTVDMGALVPVDCFKCIIDDSLDLGLSMYIDVTNPLVKRQLSRVRAYVHYYFMRSRSLWKGYQNYYTTGRRGAEAKLMPYVTLNDEYKYIGLDSDDELGWYNLIKYDTPMSLPCYLGTPWIRWARGNTHTSGGSTTYPARYAYPFGLLTNAWRYSDYLPSDAASGPMPDDVVENELVFNTPNGDTETVELQASTKISALPFVMYQMIYRDRYLNKNLTQNNKNWFPDNEDDFRLPYDATHVYDVMGKRTSSGSCHASTVPLNATSDDETEFSDDASLLTLRYRQWRGDYFTESLPWQYRGDQPTLTSFIGATDSTKPDVFNPILSQEELDLSRIGISISSVDSTVNFMNRPGAGGDYDLISQINANQVRELFVLDTFRKRMAKTDGDYNSMMMAQFGANPHDEDHKPIYIGGCSVDLNSSTVIQTSETTENSSLGEQACRMSAVVNASIGKFQVPDNGYIMAILSIVPDVTYQPQGLDKTLRGNTTMADEYFPLFNNLAPEAVIQSELTMTDDASNRLFGWQERFAYLKYRKNRNSGLIGLRSADSADYSGMTFSREFVTEPTLTNSFVNMSPHNIRRDMFSTPTEPMFIVQFASRIGAVRKMPYSSEEANLSGIAM